MAVTLPQSLVLIGAGKMGGAMLEGWLRLGMRPSGVTILDPAPGAEIRALAKVNEIRLNPGAAHVGAPNVVVLAIKPQMLDAAAAIIQSVVRPETLLISVLAGKTIADLAQRLPRAGGIVRAMPNLPASVRRGITAAVPGPGVTPGQKTMADSLLSGVGKVEWLTDEALIDAVTAVSGSGPAYVFYLVECLASAGVAAGLPADLAGRLARATVEGAGEMLFRSDLPPGVLRQNVTSPGGTTAAALEILMAETGLPPLLRRAVAAARQRAEELSG